MKEIRNKYSFFLLISCLLIIIIYPTKVKALSSNTTDAFPKKEEYRINSYDMNIVVNENNTLKITENINVNFYNSTHEIIKKIPLRTEFKRLDGKNIINFAGISDIKVNENYSISNQIGYKIIKIQDKNSTIAGQKNYTISYLYNLGKDTAKGYDELYYNLPINDWDAAIGNVTFRIEMPKAFDNSKILFSNKDEVEYSLDGNIIIGSLKNGLKSNQRLTLRIELPEGYFVNAKNPVNGMRILCFMIPIVCLLISYIIWYKYGKDDSVIKTVEFYPPSGFNSAEIGFLYKGKVDKKDIVSLFVYLANKGYIKIVEHQEKSLFSKRKGFKIVKLKDYDGNNPNEELFLKGIFSKENSEVNLMNLSSKFYVNFMEIIKNTNSKKNKKKILKKEPQKAILISGFMILSILCIIAIPALELCNIQILVFTLFIIVFYIPFYLIGFSKKILLPLEFRIFWLGFTIVHSFIFFSVSPFFEAIKSNTFYLTSFIVGLICVIGIIFCLNKMPKRTKYGNEMLGKIKGFKKIQETIEQEKLESLVHESPNYFYDILPYAYVLGINNKWIKKLKDISMQPPIWYEGHSTFNIIELNSFINLISSTVSKEISSRFLSGGIK